MFAGRFTLEAATFVAADGLASDPLDLLSAMVDRSLVIAYGDDSYRLLDSLRAYAADALDHEGPEREAAHRRLVNWLAGYAEAADAQLRGPDHQVARARMRLQVPNMRASLNWSFRYAAPQAVRLVRSLGWFWALEQANREALRWLHEALAVPDLGDDTRAELLEAVGLHSLVVGDVADAQDAFQRATDLWNRQRAPERGITALAYLGVTHRWFGQLDVAAATQDRAIELAREHHDDWALALALLHRVGTAVDLDDHRLVASLLEECQAPAERTGDPGALGWILKERSDAALRAGDLDQALKLIDQAVVTFETISSNEGLAVTLTALGRALMVRDRISESLDAHRRALRTATEISVPYAIEEALDGLAEATAAAGDHQRAAELLGTASLVRTQMDPAAKVSHYHDRIEALTASLRKHLGDDVFDVAFARGQDVAPTDVVATADCG